MSNIVLNQTALQRLLGAAGLVQSLIDNGTLAAALANGEPDTMNTAVSAFDHLETSANAVRADIKGASPFLRYRREILGDSAVAADLRRLTFNLYAGLEQINLRRLFEESDPHHIRIALECISSFAVNGDRDTFFMSLAMDIAEGNEVAMAVAA